MCACTVCLHGFMCICMHMYIYMPLCRYVCVQVCICTGTCVCAFWYTLLITSDGQGLIPTNQVHPAVKAEVGSEPEKQAGLAHHLGVPGICGGSGVISTASHFYSRTSVFKQDQAHSEAELTKAPPIFNTKWQQGPLVSSPASHLHNFHSYACCSCACVHTRVHVVCVYMPACAQVCLAGIRTL